MVCVGVRNTNKGKSKVAEIVIRTWHLLLSSRVPQVVLFLTISIFAALNLHQLGDLEVSLSLEVNLFRFPINVLELSS